MLGEAATTEITPTQDAQGLMKNAIPLTKAVGLPEMHGSNWKKNQDVRLYQTRTTWMPRKSRSGWRIRNKD